MQPSDREGIVRRGIAARQAGLGYFENPFLLDSSGSLGEWFEVCSAWAEGWLREDAGRDENVARLLSHRFLL